MVDDVDSRLSERRPLDIIRYESPQLIPIDGGLVFIEYGNKSRWRHPDPAWLRFVYTPGDIRDGAIRLHAMSGAEAELNTGKALDAVCLTPDEAEWVARRLLSQARRSRRNTRYDLRHPGRWLRNL